MEYAALLAHIETALRAITHPRFYASERGYQGELLVQLRKAMPAKLLPEEALIEQEYQKRLENHGLSIRPDIIIHEPFDPARHRDRTEGNIAVVELKLRASRREAVEDFDSLARIMEALSYPVAVFINIGSTATHADAIPESARGRIICFGTSVTPEGVGVARDGT
jgi:hypothetical protein